MRSAREPDFAENGGGLYSPTRMTRHAMEFPLRNARQQWFNMLPMGDAASAHAVDCGRITMYTRRRASCAFTVCRLSLRQQRTIPRRFSDHWHRPCVIHAFWTYYHFNSRSEKRETIKLALLQHASASIDVTANLHVPK